MIVTRPPRGGEVHDSAVERLEDAHSEAARLGEAAERVAARQAWLVWVERGV